MSYKDEPFWKELKQGKEELFYGLAKERRADLFMLDKLFEQNNINPILQVLDFLAKQTDSPLYSARKLFLSSHPSNIERVLYMVGFLKDHGVDVNSALKNWQRHGVCLPLQIQELFPSFVKEQSLRSQIVRTKYEQWLEKQKHDYDLWKKQLYETWRLEGIENNDQKYDLLLRVLASSTNRHDEEERKQALYSYNLLRERYNKPVIRKFENIDRDWLDAIEMKLFFGEAEKITFR